MTVDCRWIEKNLESLFCDRLSDEESRLARSHIENCLTCRRETQALNALGDIDALVKKHFARELEIARRPRVLHKGRVAGLSGALVFAVVLLLLIRIPATPPVPPVAVSENPTSVAPPEIQRPIKADEPGEVLRAKPTAAEPSAMPDRRPTPPVTQDSPDFLVTDPAGYSHSMDEYRGRVVVIGIWSNAEAEPVANLERLYKANADNSKIRFLGVSNERVPRPSNTTFPVLYNQGSKLFGARTGEFVLLNENGTVEMRGSLVKHFDNLQKALREK